jgi:cellulose synthase/poly-beta-1,6-N-acetylglucosamine synthase-like glycosyltransferase
VTGTFEVVNLTILVFFIFSQAHIMALAVLSWRSLRRYTFATQHGRLTGLVRSENAPTLSLVIPAYNEGPGVVEAVRSMAMLHYPRFEIVVVNDGSTDDTVEKLHEAFRMRVSHRPYDQTLPTQRVRAVYESTLPLPVRLVDKENGGKGDAVNAGLNAATNDYVMVTDADIILEEDAVLLAMRHFVEDHEGIVAVGGNIRPVNGSLVRRGKVVDVRLPNRLLERAQVLEYLRSFLSARPAWSDMGALVLVSGAFGIFRRRSLIEVGGFRLDHLGEDLELTMRLHRHGRRSGGPHRVVYAHDAVAWTEVPSGPSVLRRQRIRWHRGLMQVLWEYRATLFNPRDGAVGMVGWPSYVVFEFIAPMIEAAGWIVVPASIIFGLIGWSIAVPLFAIAVTMGLINSIMALFLDERFGRFRSATATSRLLVDAVREQLGTRQLTVWWRIRAMFWRRDHRSWGDMERAGVGNLSG